MEDPVIRAECFGERFDVSSQGKVQQCERKHLRQIFQLRVCLLDNLYALFSGLICGEGGSVANETDQYTVLY